MEKKINILHLEDLPTEALMVAEELEQGGLRFEARRVDTEVDFLRELEMRPPDVILSDHGLPSFDGFRALKTAKAKCPDTPFIFVTNSLTREMQTEKLAGGVTAFVTKDRLETLAPVIRQALEGADQFRKQDQSQKRREEFAKRLMALLAEYKVETYALPICAHCKKIRNSHDEWISLEQFFLEHLNLMFTHGICPDCVRDHKNWK